MSDYHIPKQLARAGDIRGIIRWENTRNNV